MKPESHDRSDQVPERKEERPPLSAVLDSLARGPHAERSKSEIDRDLDEERGSWDR
jgi:hypothetical protein